MTNTPIWVSIGAGLALMASGALAGEAPMLAEQVAAGTLPPLEERLPANPLVVEPLNEIGAYGGTLKRGSALLFPPVLVNLTREGLTSFAFPDPGAAPPTPNLAESWSYSEDGTVLTINLRQGVRWSDGEPFTAADVAFFWQDVMGDPEVSVPVHPALFVQAGVAPSFEQVDDFTIRFTYPEPFKYALQSFAAVEDVFAWPKHVLSKDHPRYNPQATYETFNKWAPWWSGRHAVTLGAWKMDSISGDSTLIKMSRNPYYWKVDTAGNQLPYIDAVENVIVPDRQAVALGNISGEFHYDGTWVGNQHLPLFLQEQEARGLTIGWFVDNPGMAIYLNYDNANDNIRGLFRNLSFRQALSLAIDRDSINKQFFFDLLEPSAWTFSPSSPYYDESVSKLFTERDLEEANRLLDEAGYKDSDGDGMRNYPDGSPIEIVIDVSNHDLYVPITEFLTDTLPGDIGIRFVMNNQQQDLILERRSTPNWEMNVYDIYGANAPLAKLEDWVPVAKGYPFWHQNAINESFGPEYEEFRNILMSARGLDYDEQVSEMSRANKIMAEQVFNIYIGYYRRAFIHSNALGNMPEEAIRDVQYGLLEGPMRPEQVYFKP